MGSTAINPNQTKTTIDQREVERTGTLRLMRVVDFDKIAKAHPNGTIPVEALQTMGTYQVEITPNGRGAKALYIDVADANAGAAWMDGFESAVLLKKKGPRKPNGSKPAKPKPANKPGK